MSDSKRAPTQASIIGNGEQKKKTVRDNTLIAGPSFSGKTQLYYKLIGRPIIDSVSSSEVNQTPDSVEVKVPSRL